MPSKLFLYFFLVLFITACVSVKRDRKLEPSRYDFKSLVGDIPSCTPKKKKLTKEFKIIDDSKLPKEKYSFSFVETDLREAMVEVSMQTNIPIIVDELASGSLNFEVKDKTLLEVLELAIGGGSLDFKIEKDYVFIGLIDQSSPSWQSLVYTLHYKTKNLPPIEIIKLIPKDYVDYISVNNEQNLIMIKSSRKIARNIYLAIKNVDESRHKVSLNIFIAELSENAKSIFGRTFGVNSFQQVINLAKGSLKNFVETTQALIKEGHVNVLANPVINILEGEEAIFDSLRKDYVAFGDGGSRLELVEHGVKLKIVPRVTRDYRILLDIKEIMLSDFVNNTANDSQRIHEHKVQTNVKVRQGETIMLGGMLKNKDSEEVNRVPGASKVPIFGWLFKGRDKRVSASEIIFVIKPSIICEG